MLAALHAAYIVLYGNYFSHSATKLKFFLTNVAIIIAKREEKKIGMILQKMGIIPVSEEN